MKKIICESIKIILATMFAILAIYCLYYGIGVNITTHIFVFVIALITGWYDYIKAKNMIAK